PPYFARDKVPKNVDPLQRGNRAAVIHETADNGLSLPVRILGDGQDQARRVAPRRWFEAVRALHEVPSIVAAFVDQVDLFPRCLTYIGEKETTTGRIEGKAPRIT